MILTLKGWALLAGTVIVAGVVGAVTFLAQNGTVAGQDAMTIYTTVLIGVVGVGAAHVAGQAVAQGVSNTAPLGALPPPTPPARPPMPSGPPPVPPA